MSHTRGKDKANPRCFAFECFDWRGNLFRAQGGFATANEADRAGAQAERGMTLLELSGGAGDGPTLEAILLSDDELLRELGA